MPRRGFTTIIGRKGGFARASAGMTAEGCFIQVKMKYSQGDDGETCAAFLSRS